MDANATITKTMIVVMVTSRRVGQVTLPASERTSCRNLNGLNAITLDPKGRRQTMLDFRESRAADISPALAGRMSRKTSSIVRGNLTPRRISEKRAGSRWRVSTALAGKRQGIGSRSKGASGCRRLVRFFAKYLKRWQVWQDSNSAPPVLELDCHWAIPTNTGLCC